MTATNAVDEMFKAGAHFGYSKTRRHPSVKPFIFGVKNAVEIFDLEKTKGQLEAAKKFVESVAQSGKQLLFVGNKTEIADIVKGAAERVELPYVANRWVGGTLTNFEQIRKRVSRLLDLREKKAKGGLDVYTKKEQNKIAKEIKDLEKLFSGIIDMERTPGAIFLVDSREEATALKEATRLGIPVVSISSSDCDISEVDHPVVANDSTRSSVSYFVEAIAESYKDGKLAKKPEPKAETETKK